MYKKLNGIIINRNEKMKDLIKKGRKLVIVPPQKKMGKKAALLRQKLQDWGESSDEEKKEEQTSKKFKGMIVLEGMFTLEELDKDATLLLDLKEEVREECENLGTVTNVTLYDVSLYTLLY